MELRIIRPPSHYRERPDLFGTCRISIAFHARTGSSGAGSDKTTTLGRAVHQGTVFGCFQENGLSLYPVYQQTIQQQKVQPLPRLTIDSA